MTAKQERRLTELSWHLKPGDKITVEIPDKYPGGPGSVFEVTCWKYKELYTTPACDRAKTLSRAEHIYKKGDIYYGEEA